MTAIGSSRLFVKNLPVKYTDEQVSFMTHQLNEHRERTSNMFVRDNLGKVLVRQAWRSYRL